MKNEVDIEITSQIIEQKYKYKVWIAEWKLLQMGELENGSN